ncbi:MAG: AAA family ATPase [Proteobacteria bacterium]|nr:AAA family ATPase [Pseudomonadota bacterium]
MSGQPIAPLYGRHLAIAKLTHACRQVNPSRPVWVLIEGSAGIGKTSLIEFVRKTLQLSSTQFGAGKFEQFHRHTPYGALIVALRTLLRAVLALPENERAQWRDILRGDTSAQLAPLADVLPELVELLGSLPTPATLPPKDAQQRLEAAFARLITCFARAGHPLLLFLDDLQWADVATLRLLRHFGGDGLSGHLILLGTFRDNEVTALHPLTPLLENLEKQTPPPVVIQLGALSVADIEEWLADAYGLRPAAAAAPAAWLQQQSEGNPLFVAQLLGSLRERGVLRQDERGWQWDAGRLAEARLAGNIVSFMEARLRELSLEQQELLSCAACLGTEFSADGLARILDLSLSDVHNLLERIREAQLVEHVRDGVWRFAHDRIQQAAYRLFPERERQQQHLRIGRLLLSLTAPDELDAASFDLADQFNHASLLLEPDERLQVADLNLRAGRRAKSSAAFEAALGFFRAGHALLPSTAWESHYAIAFELMKESAECAYATGELTLANELFEAAIAHARNRLDRARIYGIMIMFALNAGRARDAWDLGGICLGEFGITLGSDNQALAAAIAREEPALHQRLAEEDRQRMIDEPADCSAEEEIVADLLLRLYNAGYQMGKHPYAYITMRMLDYGLVTRHKAALSFGVMSYAVILGAHHGAYAEAEDYAQTALQLAQKVTDPLQRAHIDFIYGSMVAHWTQPVAVGDQMLDRCYEQALLHADKLYIGLALSFRFRARIMAGESIPTLMTSLEQTDPVIRQINAAPIALMYAMNRQWLRAWQGQTHAPFLFDSADFDAAALEKQLQALPAKSPYHWFGLTQAILAWMHGENALAQRWILHADGNLDAVGGQLAVPEHYFWRGLILHATGDVAALPAALKAMDAWSLTGPDNFCQRAELLRAELLRAREQTEAALAAYHAAIEQARTQKHLLLQALALERLADYFGEMRLPNQARAHMQEAIVAYRAWGAPSKVRQLQLRYPEFTAGADRVDGDLATMASQAVLAALGNIHLDRLLRQLLPLLALAAGTSRVAAFIVREGELMLEGQHGAADDHALPLAMQDAGDYPGQMIVDSCEQRMPLVLAAPATHPLYGALPCWQARTVSAVLCLPILRQGRLLGALYMERAQGDSFADALTLLESMLRQVGTALENALLYADLEQQIAERTRAEKVARESERRWRAFLEHAHMAVLTLDMAGAIEYVNPYLRELSGYAEEELIGRDWTEALLSAPVRDEALQRRLLAELHAHGHCSNSTMLRTRGGHERLIAWSSSLLRDPDGRPIGSISIGSDMTDQRNAEQALRQLNEELEQRVIQRTSDLAAANQELDSFAYSISHDLRAPLRSVDGFSQALAEDYRALFDDTANDYLRRVRNAAQRMGGMIDAMLRMSRQTRGALVREDVDLSVMAQDAVEECRLREPHRQLDIDIEPGLRIRADAKLMRIVLDNLIGNAWKYTVNSPHVVIGFHARLKGSETAYCVSDNGPGFDMAHAGKLFHAFQRLHTDADIEGHGLGLVTAQRIVHRHGGRIWVETEVGKGARFFFTVG